MIVGPAIFFLIYLFSQGKNAPTPVPEPFLPQTFLQAGEPATVGQYTFTAAPEGRAYYTRELNINKNRVIAESGNQFLVVTLSAPAGYGDPEPSQWHLAAESGSNYQLLKVLPENPAGGGTAPGQAQNSRVIYLVFKIPEQGDVYYLVYSDGDKQAIWKI